MNRRRFFGALSGVVAWAKNGFFLSPAASAVQPPCEKPWQYEVRFLTRDGNEIEPTPVFRVSEMNEWASTITIAGIIPTDCIGRTIVVSPCPADWGRYSGRVASADATLQAKH